MRTHAVLLRLDAYPDEKGNHPRKDTVANDIKDALEARGYEGIEIISQDVH